MTAWLSPGNERGKGGNEVREVSSSFQSPTSIVRTLIFLVLIGFLLCEFCTLLVAHQSVEGVYIHVFLQPFQYMPSILHSYEHPGYTLRTVDFKGHFLFLHPCTQLHVNRHDQHQAGLQTSSGFSYHSTHIIHLLFLVPGRFITLSHLWINSIHPPKLSFPIHLYYKSFTEFPQTPHRARYHIL